MKQRARRRLLEGVAGRAEEGVVRGIDQKSLPLDVRDELARAILLPVIGRAREAVDGCGEAVIEHFEVPDAAHVSKIQLIRKTPILFLDFGSQGPQEALHVDFVG